MGKVATTGGIATVGAVAFFIGVGTLWQPPGEATAVACSDTSIQDAARCALDADFLWKLERPLRERSIIFSLRVPKVR